MFKSVNLEFFPLEIIAVMLPCVNCNVLFYLLCARMLSFVTDGCVWLQFVGMSIKTPRCVSSLPDGEFSCFVLLRFNYNDQINR